MSAQTETNLVLAKRWEELFNTDVEQLVHELYAPETQVGEAVLSQDKLIRFERRVQVAAPNRFLRIARTHAVDEVVIIEGVLFDPDQGDDWKLPFCAVLTVTDGRIVRDDTYTDYSRWPGMR